MPSLMTNIKNIMRDLVNNKQIQVSFSISHSPKNSYNEKTEKWDGPLYLRRNITLWFGEWFDKNDDGEYERYYFKADHELLSFLNEFRKAVNKNIKDIQKQNEDFKACLDQFIAIAYAALERKKKKSV